MPGVSATSRIIYELCRLSVSLIRYSTMKIRRLDFRIEWINLLDHRFDFLVDGQLMRELVGATNPAGVPLWLTKPEYPCMPEWSGYAGRLLYSVCGCGEWGCGADTSRQAIDGGTARLDDFDGAAKDAPNAALDFACDNYQWVIQSYRDQAKVFSQLCLDYQAVEDDEGAIVDLYIGKFRSLLTGEDDYQKDQVVRQINKLIDPEKVAKMGAESVARRMMSCDLAAPALRSLLAEFDVV